MKKTTNDILEEISRDQLFNRANNQLSDDERKKVDSIVRGFIESFVLPLNSLIEQAQDPSIKNEIRKLLEERSVSKADKKENSESDDVT